MVDQEIRLAIAEKQLELHAKYHEETREHNRILSEGMHKLVAAEIRRENDEKTFSRLFKAITKIEEDGAKTAQALLLFKEAIKEKELLAYKSIVLRIVGLSVIIAASLFVGHYGGHLIG